MKNILIVDDEDTIRSGLAFVLKKKGYNIFEGCNGLECIAHLKNNKIDLLILDLNMPKMNGVQALSVIRTMDTYKDIPIFIYSAYIDQNDKELISGMANELLEKPVDIVHLASMVANYIS